MRLRTVYAFVSNLAPTMSSNATTMAPATLFAARCIDKPDSVSIRTSTRAAHLEWSSDSGSVVFGARFMEGNAPPLGSLIVLRGDSDSVAKLLSEDPYNKAGLWDTTQVRRWVCGMRSPEPLIGDSLFCVWCVDREGQKALRAQTRPAHLEWWKSSGRKGMIGPFPAEDGEGAVGTMIVCEGISLDDVKAWSATDPYAKAGLFAHVDVDPLNVTTDHF
jgi:uncharacterized protein